jgi:CMP-N,N'-diacetyllegionaminic acid synthase
MTPVCDASRSDGTPWHSSPTQTLPPVYVQNASLEMAWTYVVKQFGTIAGRKIAPFFTEGYEGFDINTPDDDWREAERLIAEGLVDLPSLTLGAQTPATHSL